MLLLNDETPIKQCVYISLVTYSLLSFLSMNVYVGTCMCVCTFVSTSNYICVFVTHILIKFYEHVDVNE